MFLILLFTFYEVNNFFTLKNYSFILFSQKNILTIIFFCTIMLKIISFEGYKNDVEQS